MINQTIFRNTQSLKSDKILKINEEINNKNIKSLINISKEIDKNLTLYKELNKIIFYNNILNKKQNVLLLLR